jgi:hypothetical protein
MPSTTPRLRAAAQMHVSAPVRDRTRLMAPLSSPERRRGGANRRVLEKVAADAPIFEAWSDEPWVIDGAAVRVSLICFGQPGEGERHLDGTPTTAINTDLTAGAYDLTQAKRHLAGLR